MDFPPVPCDDIRISKGLVGGEEHRTKKEWVHF
jgi:hypothetical protein